MSDNGRPFSRADSDTAAAASMSRRPGDGAVSRAARQRDETVRRWGLVSPSATRIGRADDPARDLSENVRRLHEERHPAMAGYSERAHRLDKLRITHALCTELELTPWQRDRAIGVMVDLDLTAFGSRRAIPTVALVVIRHIVDRDREHYLGLHDEEWLHDQPPERLADLYNQFRSITDDEQFTALCESVDLDITSLNRLRRVLTDQLDDQDLRGAVYGRTPSHDPALPIL
ncbi:DNA-directed RNA polymerase subunit epsilon [Halocatena salina]|uniref:DNA-directed RNA polymerase subunit epsilon n=1 Tax=Halocatena salina TaxID=2934340 RepID=A0A8U0A6S5_9EURY|nr:DNA-directed RNA polymerase subunit epsilon [Halocatena salina]UPM44228.1 DNA-directed RNA polymerase subunit epsilon [Halocatena salina]